MSPEDVSAPHIAVTANGPYVVSGLPLVLKTPMNSEHGEPIAWRRGPGLFQNLDYALCRCGGSEKKPFCDGTHARIGFDGDGPAAIGPVSDYEGTRILVRDDRTVCTHAGFCANQVTDVWKMVADTADTQVRAQVIAMIERCPSGALTYSLAPDGEPVEPDLPAQVAVVPDGPLWVTGGVSIRLAGTTLPSRNRVTLCRCGASKNKPYCDGAHSDIGFTHTPAPPAPPTDEEPTRR